MSASGRKTLENVWGLSFQVIDYFIIHAVSGNGEHTVPCGGSALGRRRVDLDG
jgi:hypothetical protein